MIHAGELSLEERGAMELLESARIYLSSRYSTNAGDWDEFHHMTAYNLLRENVTAIRVEVANRGTG